MLYDPLRNLMLSQRFIIFHKNSFKDGWTKNDLVYQWVPEGAVQIPGNLSLPGGFKLATFGSDYCDVETTTGTYSCLKVRDFN